MKTKDLVLASLFAAITCVLAIVSIPLPFTPVPITLHVFAITLCGAVLGGKLGAFSQGIYVLLGAIGLPVYAGGNAGFGHLFGPTGGYIFGFILGAYVTGTLVQWGVKKVKMVKGRYMVIVFSMSMGLLAIYLCGMLQLMIVADMNIAQAFMGGVVPFIGFDFLKVIASSIIASVLRERLIKEAVIS
ncbi:MAG: biotin transporter BioY [Epulopiscium sp.]|nr:biotin transporter BioY [Candidatus Epulonipiscium sp.]